MHGSRQNAFGYIFSEVKNLESKENRPSTHPVSDSIHSDTIFTMTPPEYTNSLTPPQDAPHIKKVLNRKEWMSRNKSFCVTNYIDTDIITTKPVANHYLWSYNEQLCRANFPVNEHIRSARLFDTSSVKQICGNKNRPCEVNSSKWCDLIKNCSIIHRKHKYSKERVVVQEIGVYISDLVWISTLLSRIFTPESHLENESKSRIV